MWHLPPGFSGTGSWCESSITTGLRQPQSLLDCESMYGLELTLGPC